MVGRTIPIFTGVECKASTGGRKRDAQINFVEQMHRAGGIAGFANSPAQALEIFEAWNLGSSMVKLYPASAVGAAYVSAILAPMPTIKIMPTGGIHISNMLAFMKSGSAALGIGSELFDKKIIQNRDKEALLNHFKLFTQQMQLSK